MDWDMKTDVQYLKIKDATEDDAGQYKVTAENDKGSTSVTVSVCVGDASSTVYESRVVSSSSSGSSALLSDPMFSDIRGSLKF